jgi:UDP-N-acetylmuramate--alanine ligase
VAAEGFSVRETMRVDGRGEEKTTLPGGTGVLGLNRRVHFIGIGGSGMSGIAEVLLSRGFEVSGSDLISSATTARLQSLGARVFEGHDASRVAGADVVVFSSAVRDTNPEMAEARRLRIPLIPRGDMLAELTRLQPAIAVAGAHGKTTTTSMIAHVLEQAGLDPTAVIGGRLSTFGGNARLGQGRYIVAEADESDRSFLKLWPAIAVITNIDREHLESYRDFDDLVESFAAFAGRVPFDGAVVMCSDDPVLRGLARSINRRVITYALNSAEAELRAGDVRLAGFGGSCRVLVREGVTRRELGELRLNVPGRHNLQNALAAVAVAAELGVPFDGIASALSSFRGAERRFQVLGSVSDVLVVDDYGHHPTEILAVLSAARAAYDRRIVVVFQPHRYSRTKSLFNDFGPALGAADEVVLTDIYAAGEEPQPGITIESLMDSVRRVVPNVRLVKSLHEVPAVVAGIARRGDVVITLGAGSIGSVGPRILEEIERSAKGPKSPAGAQGAGGGA